MNANAQPEQRADQELIAHPDPAAEFPPVISQWRVEGVNRDLTPLQHHYLSLLQRQIVLKAKYEDDPEAESWQMAALNKSIFSTLRDCIEANIGDEAKDLLNPQQRVD